MLIVRKFRKLMADQCGQRRAKYRAPARHPALSITFGPRALGTSGHSNRLNFSTSVYFDSFKLL